MIFAAFLHDPSEPSRLAWVLSLSLPAESPAASARCCTGQRHGILQLPLFATPA